jgi:Flp pilus assembly protein TadG
MIVYLAVVLVVLIALTSLGVDLGRVQLAKTELRQAADAAARYGAAGIPAGTWKQRAIDSAAENKVDGTAVALANADVVCGNWNAKATPQFSTSRTPTNAVQVTAQRTAAKGNGIKLWFASLIGFATCDVTAVSIARTSQIPSGFIGLEGFSVRNNLKSAGYDSSTNTNPTWDTRTADGMLGSNTSITAGNNEIVGHVVLGVGATHNLTLTNPATQLTVPIPIPTVDFSAAPSSNPGGVAKNLIVNSSVTLPGGTYYFTSISVANNADITFSGPATLYIDGSVNFSQDNGVYAYRRIPSNLKIFQRGAGATFGGSNANNITLLADILAPQTTFNVNNNALLVGGAIFKTIAVKNNAEFYYDEQLQHTLGVGGVAVTLVR